MHLYGLLRQIFPAWLAGLLFALIYALILGLIVVLAPVEPAEFNYGRY